MSYKKKLLVCLALFATSYVASAQEAACTDLSYHVDLAYCQSVEASSMLPAALTGGVSGSLCGYEPKTEPCRYTVPHPDAVEAINLERKDHHWWDQDIQPHCEALGPKYSSDSVRVTKVDFSGHVFGNDCYKREWKKKCVKWVKKVTVTCRLERTETKFDSNSPTCPVVNDLSRPKSCRDAYSADVDALSKRIIEVNAVLASYKREVDLYSNLAKVITQLIDAKENLKKFEYSETDVKKLQELSDYLVEKTLTDGSLKPFEAAVNNVVEIVASVGSNVPSGDRNDQLITEIKAKQSAVAKELKGKERLIYLLNVRLGELNRKLVEVQSQI
jgi:hypothetical protein